MAIDQVLRQLGIAVTYDGNHSFEATIEVSDFAQLKQLLDAGLSDTARDAHARALITDVAVPDDAPEVGLVHRLIGHVVGNQPLDSADAAALAPSLPLRISLVTKDASAPPTVINAVVDLSTTNGQLRIADYPNGLEFKDGGCFVASATPLSFTCATVAVNGSPPSGYTGHFNILGRTGAPVPIPLTPGAAGQAGSGAPGQCTSGGIAGAGGGDGHPGNTGTKGTGGGPGNDGIPSAITSIVIQDSLTFPNSTIPKLIIFTQSGAGGTGGTGGTGGPGQQGGNGGNGVSCGCTGNGGGSGREGGKGGPGGPAGDGGDGVDAAGAISISLPATVSTGDALQLIPMPSSPGKAGQRGAGGVGGAGGTAGTGGKDNVGGSPGGHGGPGDEGDKGSPGTVYGQPATFIPSNH